jgi:hypothetical protein
VYAWCSGTNQPHRQNNLRVEARGVEPVHPDRGRYIELYAPARGDNTCGARRIPLRAPDFTLVRSGGAARARRSRSRVTSGRQPAPELRVRRRDLRVRAGRIRADVHRAHEPPLSVCEVQAPDGRGLSRWRGVRRGGRREDDSRVQRQGAGRRSHRALPLEERPVHTWLQSDPRHRRYLRRIRGPRNLVS